MKTIFLYSLIISLAVIFIGPHTHAAVIDKIAVVVNDEMITQGEIDQLLVPAYEHYKTLFTGAKLLKKLEEARQKIMEQLIEDRLILGEAKKQNIEVGDKEIEERIAGTQKRMGTKERFEQALAEQRLTLKDLKTRFKEQIMVRRLVDARIGSRIKITPLETESYYNAHLNEFTTPEEIKLSNILIKPRPDLNPEKAQHLAKEVLNRIREGGDFAGLAKIYSEGPNAQDGGMMGFVKKGDLLPAIEKVVFSMKPGEVSGIIQTGMGYHIFRVEEKKMPEVMSLHQVRREVEDAVYREKSREKIKGWVENLKKNAYIAFK